MKRSRYWVFAVVVAVAVLGVGTTPSQGTTATLRGTYSISVNQTLFGFSQQATDAISFGALDLSSAPVANFIPAGGASTSVCPGTAADPKAAPGNLCVYEARTANVSIIAICRPGTTPTSAPLDCGQVFSGVGLADPWGAVVSLGGQPFIQPGTLVLSVGSWAVTRPQN